MSLHRVLGVDPGTRMAGWAVLDAGADGAAARVDSGVLRLASGGRRELGERLVALAAGLREVIAVSRPRVLAVEAAFFGKSASSALRLGEARGVVIATAVEAGLDVVELPPALVKRRIAGHGAAPKENMARLVALQLDLEGEFASADESDALAVALCAVLERGTAARHAASDEAPGPPRKGDLPRGASVQ